jgi:phosphoserine phosphatase
MFFATLLCDPAAPRLDAATADSLRNAWGGGAVRWLCPGVAAEFPLPGRPGNLWQVWAELQAIGIDLCLQPAAGRRKVLLLADMDSTMIAQECIDELADVAGVGARVAAITARAMQGEIGFEGALRERVALLAGLPEAVIAEVLATRITAAPGARVLVATMRAQGGHAALVSGGFTAFTGPVAAMLGFDEHRANTLEIRDGRLAGTVAEPILGRAAKVQALDEITARLGITPAEAIAVGDGANDLGMLARAGAGVALHAKPAVAAQCNLRVNHGDLTALLYLQGFARDDFAG